MRSDLSSPHTIDRYHVSQFVIRRVLAVHQDALCEPETNAETITDVGTRVSATVVDPSAHNPSTNPTKPYATRSSYVTWEWVFHLYFSLSVSTTSGSYSFHSENPILHPDVLIHEDANLRSDENRSPDVTLPGRVSAGVSVCRQRLKLSNKSNLFQTTDAVTFRTFSTTVLLYCPGRIVRTFIISVMKTRFCC